MDNVDGAADHDPREMIDAELEANLERIQNFAGSSFAAAKKIAAGVHDKLKPAEQLLKKEAIRQKDMAVKQGKWLWNIAKGASEIARNAVPNVQKSSSGDDKTGKNI